MTLDWFIAVLAIARDAAAVVGILLVVFGFLGRADLSHPRCRRCKHDLRPLTWTWARDAAAAERRRGACPGCGRVLRGRAIRWRPYPIAWRAVCVGAALVAVSMGTFGWAAARTRRGLTWRELVPAGWDLQAVEFDGYPGSSRGWTDRAAWETHTWQPSAWLSLNRRAAAGLLTIDELTAVGRVVERTPIDRDAPGAFVRNRGWTAPHADVLIEILHGDLDPALRGKAAAILVSTPDLSVTGAVEGEPVRSGDRVALRVISARAGELWGDHSQLLPERDLASSAREHRLDGLCFVQEVWLDGVSIPFSVEEHQLRSGTVSWHWYPDQPRQHTMPTVSCTIAAEAGKHEIAIVVDTAVVDFAIADALVESQGEPGPPERWGERTVVRRQIVRQTLDVAAALPTGAGGPP